ncbi:amidohydrolase [Crenalkalicoccus roseus]|uniref:amidohydrolase n=1 Tax=Crenalkalicoccus roseus TaxID=1485588 RepID=UPI0010815766|nr:amidohydrolase [Crenalkalicoccus roseus]
MADEITVFRARRILTMDSSCPEATHVAVREGRILAVGGEAEARAWGKGREDGRFRDLVLLPGLVEGHSHAWEGGVWSFAYAGYFDRADPEGRLWPGCDSIEAVVARLREAECALPADQPLFAWGFDPIYFGERRATTEDLDRVSATRPVVLLHSNGHVMNVNTPVLERSGLASADIEGVVRDATGRATGELREMAAKYMVFRTVGNPQHGLMAKPESLRRFAALARRAGVTTATDLFTDLPDPVVATYLETTREADFPLRLLPALNAQSLPAAEGVAKIVRLRRLNQERLRFGLVKLMTDGSIQGLSGRLKWPGYIGGQPNGIWNIAPDDLTELLHAYHAAGLQCHIHTNGDEASEVTIEAIEAALTRTPRWDHRHTLQHCQMADAAQFRRMRALGICVNLFANHVYYWGEQHAALTMGPDRARRMDACATALREGVPFAIHSDAPVTPLAPLFTAWVAVNRLTAGGRVLGPEERIPVEAALRAITLGAAYTLKLDHEIGSIEVGKRADFCVLGEDPLAVAPERLKDVPVWGTVVGGVPFPA